MLVAKQKSTGKVIEAFFAKNSQAPFLCLECGDPVILKTGRNRINHFAHENPVARHYAENESDDHRACKMQIFEALRRHPNVRDVAMELPMGANRPDISAKIKGVPVAIEIQISNLSLVTIMQRTIEYHRKGIYVLWLLQWTPDLNSPRYTPKLWEKWIHAAYFGRVYYWLEGLKVAAYHFEPHFKSVPKKLWYSPAGKKMTGGGYTQKSKRYCTAVAGDSLNLVADFGPKKRYWWEGNGIKVPDAKLFMGQDKKQRLTRSHKAYASGDARKMPP